MSFSERFLREASDNRVIVAVDRPLDAKTLDMLETLSSDPPVAYKLGWLPILDLGAMAVRFVKEATGSRVIVDVKLADVPHINKVVASTLIKSGSDALIIHGFLGPDSIRAVVEVAKPKGVGVLVVAETSNKGGEKYYAKHSIEIINDSLSLGVDGFILPGNRPERLSEYVKILRGKALVITPGVFTQGGDPRTVLKLGADFIIVGRRVYESPNPLQAIKEIKGMVREALRGV